ncbi:hypothetical protein SAMD00079811_05560 [Scytonema sp. HK-05]|nr:hypothetical protein SAMD00079811_05560 [Scytonema sp. HK-05]
MLMSGMGVPPVLDSRAGKMPTPQELYSMQLQTAINRTELYEDNRTSYQLIKA